MNVKRIRECDIGKVHLFKNISGASIKNILEESSIRKLEKKEVLFRENDSISKIYFLLEGKVSTFKISENGERKIIFMLKEGEMINEVLVDNRRNSTIGCEAFEKSLVLECDMKNFLYYMERDFALTKNILSYSELRTRRLYRQLKNSISIKIDKKLAAKLYRISKEFGIKNGEWTLINFNLTITYLADMLGCKRETLSRSMKILQDQNLVKIDGKKIYTKKEELAKYFKGN
ncbi:Crp/Fnr family transcriptional regulator [[Clostridium] dakarense]|uniref:Crp/Fnr family transcriptional regulator n=1 Tax=Faecalimicrobium dakarense TaxID=1301100 RepID=UPI0009DF94DC|nr:Crp/Fnr family transcriptional regulator [[Clostridium] dakarense]